MPTVDHILGILRDNRCLFEESGVAHAALFGSHARGEAKPDSDIDIAVAFAEGASPKGIEYFRVFQRLTDRLGSVLDMRVDLADEETLRPYIKADYARDRIRVF